MTDNRNGPGQDLPYLHEVVGLINRSRLHEDRADPCRDLLAALPLLLDARGGGPSFACDPAELGRDDAMCGRALQLLELLFDVLLESPSHRLAIYGTLAPGEPNHHVIASLRGRWSEGTVAGEVTIKDGYPHLEPRQHGRVRVKILEAANLPNHWPRIDAFEGPEYRRELVPVETKSGIIVCNIYISAC